MTTQVTSDGELSSAVNTYFEKKILQDFEPKTVWYSQAPMKNNIPKGEGKTIEFTRYKKITPKAADDTNEYTATQASLSATVVTAVIRQKSEYVELSTMATITTIGDALEQAVTKMSDTAVKALDKMVRNDIGFAVADRANISGFSNYDLAIDGGAVHSSGITVRIWSKDQQSGAVGFPSYHNKTLLTNGSLVTSIAKSAMTLATLQHGVNVLTGKDVPMINGKYKMICHTDVAYHLGADAATKGWLQYTSNKVQGNANSLAMDIAGVDVQPSTLGYKFDLSGDTLESASGSIYASLLFGAEAYASINLADGSKKGFNFYLKQDTTNSNTSDPCSLKKTAGFAIRACGKIVNVDSGLWLVTTKV